jgi:hypothetical protein
MARLRGKMPSLILVITSAFGATSDPCSWNQECTAGFFCNYDAVFAGVCEACPFHTGEQGSQSRN